MMLSISTALFQLRPHPSRDPLLFASSCKGGGRDGGWNDQHVLAMCVYTRLEWERGKDAMLQSVETVLLHSNDYHG